MRVTFSGEKRPGLAGAAMAVVLSLGYAVLGCGDEDTEWWACDRGDGVLICWEHTDDELDTRCPKMNGQVVNPTLGPFGSSSSCEDGTVSGQGNPACNDYTDEGIDDYQVKSHCQQAWLESCNGNTQGVEASCSILDGYARVSISGENPRDLCPYCSDGGSSASQEGDSITDDWSDTCAQSCTEGAGGCSVGETCFRVSVDGYKCLPSQCQECFDVDARCNYNAITCEYLGC